EHRRLEDKACRPGILASLIERQTSLPRTSKTLRLRARDPLSDPRPRSAAFRQVKGFALFHKKDRKRLGHNAVISLDSDSEAYGSNKNAGAVGFFSDD